MGLSMIWGAVGAFVVGLLLYFTSSKTRTESGEWSSGLQWGYLLMMVGVFGVLSSFVSFTAVLLVFVLFTGVVWFIHKRSLDQKTHTDGNHFTDYMSGFFPIILVVFVLRTFIAEPFQIPSSSMRPGLVVGDFILVNKFSYGVRMPIANNVLLPVGEIQRGDVVVFNYPEDNKVSYIKRAIGLPGDVIEYKNKQLTVNGQAVPDQALGMQDYMENTAQNGVVRIVAEAYRETLDERQYDVLKMAGQPDFLPQGVRPNFPFRQNCHYADDGSAFSCRVPEGNYFMLGDNRDNSEDSRYWGFVSERLIVGKAFLIWMNFGDMSRVGNKIQ